MECQLAIDVEGLRNLAMVHLPVALVENLETEGVDLQKYCFGHPKSKSIYVYIVYINMSFCS